jgi:hypothetical protein
LLACTVTYLLTNALLKQRPFPAYGCTVHAVIGTMASSDSLRHFVTDFAFRLIPLLTQGVGLRHRKVSLVPSSTFIAFRSLLRRRVLRDFSPRFRYRLRRALPPTPSDNAPSLPWPSPSYDRLGFLLLISTLDGIHGYPLRTAFRLLSLRHTKSPSCSGNLTTRLSGDYRDRTFTCKQTMIYQDTP